MINFQAGSAPNFADDKSSPSVNNNNVVIDITKSGSSDISNNNNQLTINVVNNNEKEEVLSPVQVMKFKMASWTNLLRNKKYNKVGTEEDKEKEEEEEKKKENVKDNQSRARTSRLDVSSLKAVTRKMHFSYLVAILFIVIALMTSYLVHSLLFQLFQLINLLT